MSTFPSPATPEPDLAAITRHQQQMWSEGDFAAIGGLHLIVSELLCEAVDLHPGQRVLDVACGSGNTTLAAARRFADATGIDYVPALLARARERAAVERLPASFDEGDAAHLPYPDGSFDVVLSTFGSMFSPDQAGTAAEMVRVGRPGGTIGMANWTPESWPGIMFRTIATYVPQAPGLLPPTRWGAEDGLRELFGNRSSAMRVERRDFSFRFRSPAHWLEYFGKNLGPMVTAFAALEPRARQEFADELLARLSELNLATDGTLVAPSPYLEAVIMRA